MLDKVFAAATGKVILVAFAVLLVSTYAIKNFSPKESIVEALGTDYISTDNPPETEHTLWYDTARVTNMLGKYKPEHYSAHESFILGHDLVYPLCYSIPGVLLLAYFCPWRSGGARRLVLLPLCVMALDYGENFTMLAFLYRFRASQQTSLTLLEISRVFTFAKLCLLLLSFAVMAFFVVAFIVSRLRARSATR
jgi:hypothetical protein